MQNNPRTIHGDCHRTAWYPGPNPVLAPSSSIDHVDPDESGIGTLSPTAPSTRHAASIAANTNAVRISTGRDILNPASTSGSMHAPLIAIAQIALFGSVL